MVKAAGRPERAQGKAEGNMRTVTVAAALALLLIHPAVLPAQPEGKLSAREIFYSAPKAEAPAPPAAKPAKPAAPKAPGSEVSGAVKPSRPPRPPSAPPPPENEPGFVPVSIKSTAPLGIRCSVLKRAGPSDLIEVDPGMVFRSGERIKLRVEVNDDGYLYVVLRGSSGVWKPLFPSPEVDGGANRVSPGRPYDVPPGHVFTFDDQPGEEKLFVVFSREPVRDLEGLIYDLGSRPQKPAAAPSAPAAGKVLLAENRIAIRDDVVNTLRTAYARDLIIEKVDDSPGAGAPAENAVYAVAAPGAAAGPVLLDFSLTHR
jgi:hypothetical protein